MFKKIPHLGLSCEEIGALFGRTAERVSSRIRETREHIVKKKFIASHVGFGHVTPAKIIAEHTTPFARAFFGGDDTVVAIADGMTFVFSHFSKAKFNSQVPLFSKKKFNRNIHLHRKICRRFSVSATNIFRSEKTPS